MIKMLKILEKIWLGIGAISLLVGTYSFLIKKDNSQGIYFLVLALISGLMFYVRNRRRKLIEKQAAEFENSPN